MAINDLGMVRPGSTILVPFATYDSNDPSDSVVVSAFVLGDVGIYKGTSMVERASTTGVVLLDTDGINIDGAVGIHGLSIDLSSNATAGFYTCGSRFYVTVGPMTVDGATTVSAIVATFEIGYPGAILNTTIATLASQISFTLTAGSADDDAYNGWVTCVHDIASAVQVAVGHVSDYTGSSKTVTLTVDPAVFTAAAGDHISLFPPSNVGAISGDPAAADNLELMYDGTGYTDTTAPASRAQVGTIATVSGGSINFAPTEDNSGGTIDPSSTAFVGVETNNYTDVAAENGTRHQIADSVNVIDVVYGFQIGGGRLASEVAIKGFANNSGPTDDLTISAYDHDATAFEVIGTFEADSTTDNITKTISLLTKHTGTGSELGKTYIRFNGSSLNSDADLNIDQMLVSAVSIGQSVGYALGAIWIDTDDGVSGTEAFVNGVADNPCLTLANSVSLSASTLLHRFILTPDSSITFAEAHTNEVWEGEGFDLALGGQDVGGSHFMGADVSGTGTGSVEIHFDHCEIGNVTVPEAHFDACDISGTIIISGAADYVFVDCSHGGSTATIDFGAAVGNTTIHVHNYHGALIIANMGQTGTDVLHFSSPDGKLTLAASCVGGTVHMNGTFDFVNSGSGMTINDDGAILETIGTPVAADISTDIANIQSDTDDIQTRLPAALSSGNMKTDVLAIGGSTTAADKLEEGAEALAIGTVNDAGATTTVFIITLTGDTVDATDDHYNGRIITFTSGILLQQSTDITDYNGTTKAVTVTALTEAPGNGDQFVIS